MARVGAAWAARGIDAVYLIHGTFVGDDACGAWHRLAQFWSPLGAGARLEKRVVDFLVRDVGNYTARYERDMSAALNEGSRTSNSPLEVRRWVWNSQNNHVGRADAALRLIGELARRPNCAERRVLLWGHSHAGNVFALVSNLLSASETERGEFLARCRPYYWWLGAAPDEHPTWRAAQQALVADFESTRRWQLDLVTFGTPIRYGWNLPPGCRLLHVVHHRRGQERARRATGLPFRWYDAWAAREGDYVQRVGVAGTDFAPCFIFRRGARRVDRDLRTMLQGNLTSGGWFDPMRASLRVADEGPTVAVDYGALRGGPLFHLFGHGVYTRRAWMLFHSELVAEWLEQS